MHLRIISSSIYALRNKDELSFLFLEHLWWKKRASRFRAWERINIFFFFPFHPPSSFFCTKYKRRSLDVKRWKKALGKRKKVKLRYVLKEIAWGQVTSIQLIKENKEKFQCNQLNHKIHYSYKYHSSHISQTAIE